MRAAWLINSMSLMPMTPAMKADSGTDDTGRRNVMDFAAGC
jgi:hypothetical protein